LNLIDTHAHLNMDRFDSDRDAAVKRAARAGIAKIIDIGTDLASSRAAVGLSRIFDPVFAAVGIHPHEAAKISEKDIIDLQGLLRLDKTVAIGEAGLDYHYDYSPRNIQKEVFIKQLQISLDLQKPIIIHVREAMTDALQIIDSVSTHPWKGVFHCFGGDETDAAEVLKRGFHISFTGVITFKNFKNNPALKLVPDDKLMLETDCPFMAPVPLRGKRCEPAFLPHTLKAAAEIRNISDQKLAAITTANAEKLFGLGINQ